MCPRLHRPAEARDGEVTAQFEVEGPWNVNAPVHENLTLAALMASNYALDSSIRVGTDQAANEFLRGVFWNDDPALLLFENEEDDNWDFTTGAVWYTKMNQDPTPDNITSRSHNGDLQSLHSMAVAAGEAATTTKQHLGRWVEAMYKLAVGEYAPTKVISTTPIAPYFSAVSDPTSSQTLRDLLVRDSEYTNINIQKRALGSVMHTIQDSYVRSHCRRELLNPGDRIDSDTPVWKFPPGLWALLGNVEVFHTYVGQDHNQHGLWDGYDEDMDPSNLSTFNALNGGRVAIEKCIGVINYWHQGKSWNQGPQAYLMDAVFALSPNVQPADPGI